MVPYKRLYILPFLPNTPPHTPTGPNTNLSSMAVDKNSSTAQGEGAGIKVNGRPLQKATMNPSASTFTQGSTIFNRSNVSFKPGFLSAANQVRKQDMVAPRRRPGNRTQFGGTQLQPINEVGQLTKDFDHLQVGGGRSVALNPSEAPGRSTFGKDWRSPGNITTQLSTQTQTQWIRTPTCVKSPFTRRIFQRGQVITLPFHQPNLAPDIDPADECLTLTKFGPVYTKRRMAVVLWRHKNEMMCLPIHSWGGRGIDSKPKFLKDQYMEIVNAGPEAEEYESKGSRGVLHAHMKHPMEKQGCVCLAAGFRVDYHEDLLVVGILDQQSIVRMVKGWDDLMQVSKNEKF